jgi:hypothetical protein
MPPPPFRHACLPVSCVCGPIFQRGSLSPSNWGEKFNMIFDGASRCCLECFQFAFLYVFFRIVILATNIILCDLRAVIYTKKFFFL